MIDESKAAWAAGFLEGEGCFFAYAPYACGIKASQIRLGPIARLQEMFGGAVARKLDNGEGRVAIWLWEVNSADDIFKVVDAIEPFLTANKQYQARQVRAFAATKRARGSKIPLGEDVVTRREVIAHRLADAKRGRLTVNLKEKESLSA